MAQQVDEGVGSAGSGTQLGLINDLNGRHSSRRQSRTLRGTDRPSVTKCSSASSEHSSAEMSAIQGRAIAKFGSILSSSRRLRIGVRSANLAV